MKAFSENNLHHEKIKTGILILISLQARQFQILGNQHIHEKIGQRGWEELTEILSSYFKEVKFYDGLMQVLQELEKHLVTHFAYRLQ